LAGVGVLAIPLAWRSSKLKLKEQLDDASRDQVENIFKNLRAERVPAIRNMAASILEQFRLRLDRQLNQIESAIIKARERRPSGTESASLEHVATALQNLLIQKSTLKMPT
jgi:hypothetical protein